MRWFIAAVALTVICAMFGSAAALVLGGAALKLPRTDRPVLSLSGPRDLGSRGQPSSLKISKADSSVAAQPIEQ